MSEPLKDRYAVIGNPVAHSQSPTIHSLFADQTGEMMHYEKLFAEKDKFSQVANAFFDNGGKGLNVTVPFKNAAYHFADERDDYAERANSVNTLYKNAAGKFVGANTDGIGLLRDLKKTLRLQLASKKILIVGAGGATQGLVEPLLNENPSELLIANRTLSRAKTLAQRFSFLGETAYCALCDIPEKKFDLIIQATSAGLQGDHVELPVDIIGPDTSCYDLLYSDQDTPFMHWAKNNNAKRVVDGFGMLLEQAAEAFYLWRGQRPDTGMAYHYFRPDLMNKPGL